CSLRTSSCCSHVHSALHSFPTRRSSDLRPSGRPRHPARRTRTPDRSGRERRHRRIRPPRPRTHRRLALPGEPPPVTADPHTDTIPAPAEPAVARSVPEEPDTAAAPSDDAAHPRRGAPWLRASPAVCLLAWGGNHFSPRVPLDEEDGGYAVWQANLLLGMYVGGLIPGLRVASALSDRHGRKPIPISGSLAAIIGSVGLGLGFDLFWLLCAGRVLAGIGVGVAMSVGTSWIKELSAPPFDHRANITAGARRPALTLTLGFALGAAVTGCLAQWGPLPEVLPYAVHGLLNLVALLIAVTAPETLPKHRRTDQHW